MQLTASPVEENKNIEDEGPASFKKRKLKSVQGKESDKSNRENSSDLTNSLTDDKNMFLKIKRKIEPTTNDNKQSPCSESNSFVSSTPNQAVDTLKDEVNFSKLDDIFALRNWLNSSTDIVDQPSRLSCVYTDESVKQNNKRIASVSGKAEKAPKNKSSLQNKQKIETKKTIKKSTSKAFSKNSNISSDVDEKAEYFNMNEVIDKEIGKSTQKNTKAVVGLGGTNPKSGTALNLENKSDSMVDLDFIDLIRKSNSLLHDNGTAETLGSFKANLLKYPEVYRTSENFETNPCTFTYVEINKN